jgi:hypothetical protein
MEQEVSSAVGRAVPGSIGAVLFGLTLNEWVAVVTIVYFVLQIALLLHKFFKDKDGH